MKLGKLLQKIAKTKLEIEVKNLCLFSGSVQKGDVFCDLSNNKTYRDEAIDLGASVVLATQKIADCEVPHLVISDLVDKLETLATRCYPEVREAKIIAVTGTNGKTSVSLFLTKLLQQLGHKAGYIGTEGVVGIEFEIKIKNTTPDIFTLYQMIQKFVNQDIKTIVLEASSHGLAQNRLAGLNIESAIFTNLTQDHLDYHKTEKAYKKAKQSLFELKSLQSVIINTDDEFGKTLFDLVKVKKHGFNFEEFNEVRPTQFGFVCQIEDHLFELPLLAQYNLMNVLAVVKQLQLLGFSLQQIVPLLAKINPVEGRMQQVEQTNIWIDFAHTPDALLHSLEALQTHFPNTKIRVVFGCGGNRDKDKRAKMGKIAYKNADVIILTNDNPRDENPAQIIADIELGFKDIERVQIIPNREEAIATAISNLTEDECVLIAGKGSETIQIIGDKWLKFSDIEVVKKLLNT
jgi:UDP-N-acetylmuramoyl-L-alanyl-D-glutamate--2,6-diaminopimelate ligase